MSYPAPGPPADLAARVFRALYVGFELRTLAGIHVAVPMGTPWYAAPSLAALARQISAAPSPRDQPSHPAGAST